MRDYSIDLRIIVSAVLVAAAFSFGAPEPAVATSGACSWHGGVDCAAGPDWDGSVICYDGWRDSSVSYSSMVMCSSYGYTTPSCPFMSYYDSLSSGCKCMSGYVVDTDIFGNQTCASGDSVCREELGIMSRYNSLSRTCECSYGYVIYNGKCTSEDDRCTGLYGYGARYNILSDSCECRSGYTFNGSRCELDLSDSGTYFYYPPSASTPSCPAYSTLNADGNCYCDVGYVVSANKTACVAISCQNNSTLVGNTCVCNFGFVSRGGQCVTPTDDCQATYGPNVYGVRKDDTTSNCYCDQGYQWNSGQTACIEVLTGGDTSATGVSGVDMGTYCKSIFGGSGIFNNTTGNCEKSGTNLPIEEDTAAQYPAEDRLIGRILLQVESYGEAWYVNPSNKRRYYMKDGATAYQMMRTFGLGITNEDLAQIPAERDSESMKLSSSVCVQNSLANRLKGKILLQVQQNGEAWYVHPDKCRRIYMQDGASAYNIMRYLSLGISNMDIAKIDTGSLGQ